MHILLPIKLHRRSRDIGKTEVIFSFYHRKCPVGSVLVNQHALELETVVKIRVLRERKHIAPPVACSTWAASYRLKIRAIGITEQNSIFAISHFPDNTEIRTTQIPSQMSIVGIGKALS